MIINFLIPILLLFTPIFQKYLWNSRIILFFTLAFYSILLLYSPINSISFSSFYCLLDQLGSSLITLSFWISALIILCRYKVFNNNINSTLFVIYVSILCFLLILAFSVSNLISFYLFFEASLIPTFLLIIGWGYQPERLQASLYLLLYTITASLPLLLSLSFIFYSSGSLFIHPFSLELSLFSFSSSSFWWIISILAFLVKIPIYISHLWLPKAHVEAPVAGSIILAGILLKLGGYGLLRVSTFFPILSFNLSPVFSRIAIWGGVITRIICLRQSDLKSLIAYSSIGHIALVILGILILSSWGWQGAIVIIIAHGLCSSALFAIANITYESASTRSIFLIKGILRLAPSFTLWWFLFSITNMAAPPSINLFGEIALIISSLWISPLFIIPLGCCSWLACAYSLYLFTSTNHGPQGSFSNPSIFSLTSFNSLLILHFIPIWLFILKPEIISAWWPYSWLTTLNCKFKSVLYTKAYFISILVHFPSKKKV